MDTSLSSSILPPAPGAVTTESNKNALTSIDNSDPIKYSMVALDLDGTLLHSNHRMSDKSAEYLRNLKEKGILVILATGRAQQTCYEHVLKLGPLAYPKYGGGMPVVCSNGAKGLICRRASNENNNIGDKSLSKQLELEELFYTPVPRLITTRVVELANKLGHCCQFYWKEDVYANPSQKHHFECVESYKELTGANTKTVEDDFHSILATGALPSKMLVLFERCDQEDAMHVFRKELGDEATVVRGSYGWFLEILHKDVCKGHGLRSICERLKIPIEQCVAFGDGDNDLEFLEMAGRGVAMKNARDCVKKAADYIAEYTNNEDGVIRVLKQMEMDGQMDIKT